MATFRLLALNLEAQVLTSSWNTGEPGPIAYCVPEGAIPPEDVVSYNKSHHGRSMIVFSGTGSHFMSGEVLLQVFEQLYSPAFAAQRARPELF